MLKMCFCFSGSSPTYDLDHQESGKKKGMEAGVSISYDHSCTRPKDFSVRIVHAGGREELYKSQVPASQLMEKYPGMCVARPQVFKNPQESLLFPDENLLPGNKYLIIPSTTAQKLKRKYMESPKGNAKESRRSAADNELADVNITWDESGDFLQESISSAKDFYASKGKSYTRLPVRKSVKAKKPFVPPLPKLRAFRSFGWEPSLTSVQEVSP